MTTNNPPVKTKRARRKKKVEGEEPKKRGNPGNFSGARLQFLCDSEPAYLAASMKGRGHIAPFISKIMADWWQRFPWYDGLDAEGAPMPVATVDMSKLLALTAVDLKQDDGEQVKQLGNSAANVAVEGIETPLADDAHVDASEGDVTLLDASVPNGANPSKSDASGAVSGVDDEDADPGWTKTGGVNPALKGTIQAGVKEKIKNWFSYRKTVSNRSNRNPYKDWLSGFRRPSNPPKKLPLNKFFMQQEGYKEEVEALFQERWPTAGLESKNALAFRCTLAQELLDAEPEEVVNELVDQQNAEHEEALEEYENHAERIANPDAPDEEDQHHCRTNLAQVVQPFIDGIAKLTGFHVTFLAGAPPPPGGGTKFALTTMHSGRTYVNGPGEGQKFDEWDIDGFKKLVLGQFMKYLLQTAPHCQTGTDLPATEGNSSSAGGGEPGVTASGDEEENPGEGNGRARARAREKGKGKGKARAGSASPTPSPSVSRSSSRSGSADATPSPTPPPPAELPLTPTLRHNRVLPDDVLKYVNAQATPRRRDLMRNLAVANDYLYTREVNIVRNRATMEGLGLMGAMLAVGADGVTKEKGPPKPLRGKAAAAAKGLTATRRSGRLAAPSITLPVMNSEGDIVLEDVEDDLQEDGGAPAGDAASGGDDDVIFALQDGAPADDGEGGAPVGDAASGGDDDVIFALQDGGPADDAARGEDGAAAGDTASGGGGKNAAKNGASTNDLPSGAGGENDAGAGDAHAQGSDSNGGGASLQVALRDGAEKAPPPRADEAAGGGGEKGKQAEVRGEERGKMSIDSSGWPKWMEEGFEILSACEGGPDWKAAVRKWAELERAYGFQNSTTPLPTAGRPKAIHEWVKGGRSTTRKPTKFELSEHIATWKSWWDGMAPSWRVRDASGRLLAEKEGAWGVLVKPGGNGMLTALLCLVWWLDREGKMTEEWATALKDVKWVLEGLVGEVNSKKRPRSDAGDVSDAPPAVKRQRRR